MPTASCARWPTSRARSVVLFFGYAQCPDVCPTTMAEMAQVKQQLGQRRRQAAGAVRHGRSGARHARGDEGLHGRLRPGLRRADPARPSNWPRWRRTSRSTTRRSRARRRPAIRWTTRPPASSTTRGPAAPLRALRRAACRAMVSRHQGTCWNPIERAGRSGHWQALSQEKARHERRASIEGAASAPQANSASAFFIFFIAATSIWRMRSALTP